MKKPYRHFGKAWTLEHKGNSSFITNASSAATVEVKASEKDPTSVWCSSLALYSNVPPYIQRIVEQHLLKN